MYMNLRDCQTLVRKYMDVNELERLSNITLKTQLQAQEHYFH